MKQKIFFIFVVLLLLSGAYPLYFHFSEKTVAQIPAHHTYRQAVGRLLPDSIKIMAQKHHCRGYVLPVNQVEGPDFSFPHLKDDINLALTAYDGWQIKVSDQERQQMKKRLEQNIKKWGAMLSGSELMRIALTQKAVDAQTQTSVTARWFYLPSTNGDDVKLLVTVNDELRTTRLFQISLTFMHPKTLAAWQQKIEQRQKQLAKRERLARVGLTAFYGFSGLFGLFLLFVLGQALALKIKDQQMRKRLLQEIGKREELVENGHFVTAYELTQKYLKYFPDDTEIRAFQQRLLDFTNNDPKTAQKAYVEAKKLQTRLAQFADDPQKLLLDQQEKSTIQALLPYHPELNKAYHQILKLEETTQIRLSLEKQLKELQSALKAGYLHKAESLLRQIQTEHPDAPELEIWQKEWQIKQKEAAEHFERLKQSFIRGKLNEGQQALEDFLKKFKDHPQALKLQEDLQKAAGQTQLILRWSVQNAALHLFLKDELILGRQDDGAKPDMAFDDRRISRQHATIRFKGGKAEITDNGSTGGTFVNGQKIDRAVLKDGDIVNLAKIKEFRVNATTDAQGQYLGLLLSSKNENMAMVPAQLSFALQQGAFTNMQTDFTIFSDRQKAVLVWSDGLAALFDGQEIVLENEKIIVEAL